MPRYQVFVNTNLSLEQRDIPEHIKTLEEVREFIHTEMYTTISDEDIYSLAFLGLAPGEYDDGMLVAEAEVKLCLLGTFAPLV